jgi:two-component system sensor histidine kinase VicK
MSRLFTRFGKIGTTVRAGHIGTGLGLYISRGMVEGMHGRIWVDSALGQGSTFNVALPLTSG